jgi:hypothetical protein
MKGSFSSIVLRRIFPVSGINRSFDASAYYIKFRIVIEIYLFPDLSRDERRVDDNHVKGAMQLGRQVLGLVEIVEDEAGVLVELLIELLSCLIQMRAYIKHLRGAFDLFVLKREVDARG